MTVVKMCLCYYKVLSST